MRYFVITDNSGFASGLHAIAPDRDEIFFFKPGGNGRERRSRIKEELNGAELQDMTRLKDFKISSLNRVIINLENDKDREKAISDVRSLSQGVPILLYDLSSNNIKWGGSGTMDDPGISVLPLKPILKRRAMEKWHQIEIKRKIERMKKVLDKKKPIWILLQNDPDPDSIASAMALQALLGRNDKSAPIVTFKRVARNENLAMINIIKVKIREVTPAQAARAPQIALVDIPPPYFKRTLNNLRIVVDHHPVLEQYDAPYVDVQEHYGATASIFVEYLVASEMKIGQRLATALYYGVKTDTLLFGRDVSHADFSAFALLWPKANHYLIMQMERPRLKSEEVDVFVRALKGHAIEKSCIFSCLGPIPKEDLVPRLADFILQIGEPEFALVWGIVGKECTFSARSITPKIHAGDVMAKAFGKIGSAGGHQSMARATMLTSALKKELKAGTIDALKENVKKRVLRIVSAQKKMKKRTAKPVRVI
ncbi:MAG: bifunctional oligoribonuclease/PAP phosphatase NrnA [Nitrospinota bacterium]